MENNYNKFRRVTFGGFNREDVISYIEKMKNEFFDYKKEVEQTVSQLNTKIRELETAFDNQVIPKSEETAFVENEETNPVSDINEATQKLRMVADELCKSLCDFMEKVSENTVSVVIESKAEEAEENTQEDEVEIHEESVCEKEDKVSSILKAVDSFSCSEIKKEQAAEKVEKVGGKRNILDLLESASFLK